MNADFYLLGYFVIGLLLAELSVRQAGIKKFGPLSYLFVLIFWPIIAPIALGLAIYLTTIKRR